jgi:glycerol-3-phosphate dehydrogenase
VLLDARARSADIKNRRAVTAIAPLADGYTIELDERGAKSHVEARFVVNASGPWAAAIDAMSSIAPPPRPLRLVRGSHIVLDMPDPPLADAYTLQDQDERVVFTIPWLDRRFLIVGTTDVPHEGDAGHPHCTEAERSYLLDAYNRYFAPADGPATDRDIVFTWSGVRALHDDAKRRPSRISRSPAISTRSNGNGGFVTLYGGKLTTHRAFAEEVVDTLRVMGANIGGGWTMDVPLYGGTMPRASLLALAGEGPEAVPHDTRRRWALSYGDQIQHLYEAVMRDPGLTFEIAPGVTLAELTYAREVEDAMTGEDFLLRRSKLHLLLDQDGRDTVTAWFEKG